jgi:hypothetical protein
MLLSVIFACGLVIAVAHVLNRGFVAPVYDGVANLTALGCAVAASLGPDLSGAPALEPQAGLVRRPPRRGRSAHDARTQVSTTRLST